jgi:hydrogenase-4 component B
MRRPPSPHSLPRFVVDMHDPIWETLYAPIGKALGFATERINVLQFLTIRRYLTLVFVALIVLLVVLAL